MKKDQMTDPEAIAALDAFHHLEGKGSPHGPRNKAAMRRALDASAAYRKSFVDAIFRDLEQPKEIEIPASVQPASGLADDARKIVDALDDPWTKEGRAAIALAESLPGRIGELEKERDEAIKAAYPIDMFDPTKRATESYKDAWEAAIELGIEDHKEHCRLMRLAESNLAVIAHRDRMMNSKFVDVAARDAEITRLREAISQAENTLCGSAQLIDSIKMEWEPENSWSEWDQGVRDAITASLRTLHDVRTALAAPVAEKEVMDPDGTPKVFANITNDQAKAKLAGIIDDLSTPVHDKTPPYEPTDHEAEGAMLFRGKHEARTNEEKK